MIEVAYKTETIEKEIVDTENSHVYCDHCQKEIPINSRIYSIHTGHSDWGMDSIESIEYKQFCSSDCLVKHITYDYTENHGLHKDDTQYFEISKKFLNSDYIDCYGEEF